MTQINSLGIRFHHFILFCCLIAMAPFPFPWYSCKRSFQSVLNKFSKLGFEILYLCFCSKHKWHRAYFHVFHYVISYVERRKGRERENEIAGGGREGFFVSTVILTWNCANLLTQSATGFSVKLPVLSLPIFTVHFKLSIPLSFSMRFKFSLVRHCSQNAVWAWGAQGSPNRLTVYRVLCYRRNYEQLLIGNIGPCSDFSFLQS